MKPTTIALFSRGLALVAVALCAACSLGEAVPPPRAPVAAPSAPAPTVPAVEPPTESACSEVACAALVTPPGDGVARINLKDGGAGASATDEYVKLVNAWGACVPCFERSEPTVQARALDTLRQLRALLEGWFAASPALRSSELTGSQVPIIGASGAPQPCADRRDLARAFHRVETHLRRGLGSPTVAGDSEPELRDLGALMLRVDALAGTLSLELAGDAAPEQIDRLLSGYALAMESEARAWAASATEQSGEAVLSTVGRPLARVARGVDEYVAKRLTFVDMSLPDRVLSIERHARLLGEAWGERSSVRFRDALGIPASRYLDALSNIPGGELIDVHFVTPLPTKDGTALTATGRLSWLALVVRAFDGGNTRALFQLLQGERDLQTLLADDRPQSSVPPGSDDGQDARARGAFGLLLRGAGHIIDDRARLDAVTQAATRLDLEIQSERRLDAASAPVRGMVRRRLSRAYAEVALCVIDAGVRGRSLTECEVIAVDPDPTAACEAPASAPPPVLADALAGRTRAGAERLVQTLAHHAELSASSANTANGGTVGWTRRTRCALETLAARTFYPQLGFGERGGAAMLRLIGALQLRPSEPSVRAIAIATLGRARASLQMACFDARGKGCDETLLARRVEENRKKAKSLAVAKAKSLPIPDDEPARLQYALVTYCDAAVIGGIAFDAIVKGRPNGALSIVHRYWNGSVPAEIDNLGAGVRAESAACMGDSVWKEMNLGQLGKTPAATPKGKTKLP